MLKRFIQVSGARARWLQLLGCGLLALACLALIAGGYEAYQQYQERQALEAIAKPLRTGDPAHDIQAVVNYVYDHAYLGDGKYGLLRASATQILDPNIGGQCGEFVRLTVNLLDVMGYTAHRLYMFPVAEKGRAFDPATQASFHVAAEVWVNGRWILVDPLHGLVFHDQSGNLVTIQQVVNDPAIIQQGYSERPLEVHEATYGAVISAPYWINALTFSNPQGLNWGQRPFSWLHKASQRFGSVDLSTIYLPVVAEQPYAMQAIFCLTLFALFAAAGSACFSRAARASARYNLDATRLEASSPNLQTA